MSDALQQINLYQPSKLANIDILTTLGIMQFAGVFLIILTMATLYQTYSYFSINYEVRKLEAKAEEVNKRLVAAENKIPTKQEQDNLKQQISVLENENALKKMVLDKFAELDSQKYKGFSGYMEALARQAVPGTWMTKFSFEESGDFLYFEGKAKGPQYIPELIAGIDKEPVFQGKTFQVLKLNVNPTTKLIEYVLQTEKIEKP